MSSPCPAPPVFINELIADGQRYHEDIAQRSIVIIDDGDGRRSGVGVLDAYAFYHPLR